MPDHAPPSGAPPIKRLLISLDQTLVDRIDRHTRNRSAYIAHAVRRALEAEGA